MNGRNGSATKPGREARMIMREDEHVLIKAMVWKALGDDSWFGMVDCGDGSESGRAEDRCVLARFLARMERQFDARANGRGRGERSCIAIPLAGRVST